MAKVKKKPRAKYAKGAVRTQAVLTQKQVYLLAREHGATPLQAVVTSAVVMAESGGRVRAFNGSNSNGTWDAGLGQINQIHGYSKEELFDPHKNMEAIKKISGGFKNWSPWVAYNTGAYRRFMSKKDSLLKAKGPSKVKGTKGASPSTERPAISNAEAQMAASFAGGLPGTEILAADIPGIPGLDGIPGIPGTGLPTPDDILNFPTAIEDTFRLINHMFEAKFWYRTGKVVLGVGALIVGINYLLKATTGTSPIGAVKKGATTAASIAATKGASAAKGKG